MIAFNGTSVSIPPTTTPAPGSTPSGLDYRLTVAVETPGSPEVFRGRAYYRVRFTATGTADMPSAVFVHQRHTAPTGDHDTFVSVAGPVDMVQIPEVPDVDSAFFRQNTADILLDSVDFTDKTVDTVKEALQYLVNGLESLEHMQALVDFTVYPKE